MPRFKNSQGEVKFAPVGSSDYQGLMEASNWELDTGPDANRELPANIPLRGGMVNGVMADLLLTPAAGVNNSAIVIKVPDAEWGSDTDPGDQYGEEQVFLVLKEGDYSLEDIQTEGSLFRINGKGAVGFNGGAHIATGLRARPGEEYNYSIHVDPSVDSIGMILETVPGGVQDLLRVYNNAGEQALRIEATGVAKFQQGFEVHEDPNTGIIMKMFDQSSVERARVDEFGNLIANFGQTQETAIGNTFGFPTLRLGPANTEAVYVHKAGPKLMMLNAGVNGTVKLNDGTFEMDEVSEPAAPAADTARLWIEDNGSGKSRLCAKFATGAKVVLATQP